MKLKLAKKVFYSEDADMRKSFKGLIEIAEQSLGADLNDGDIVIFDNKAKDRRKILVPTKGGFNIFYLWREKSHGKFIPYRPDQKALDF